MQMDNHKAKQNTVSAWMTFGRGLFAVALGVALIIRPDAAMPFVGNFIGAFWVSGGLLSLRWGLHAVRARPLTLLVGIIGIIAGAFVSVRQLIMHWIDSGFIIIALGVVALLTGFLHISGHMSVRHGHDGTRSHTAILLGIMEIVLGVVFILGLTASTITHVVLIIWALVGGAALFNDARLMRREVLSDPMYGSRNEGEELMRAAKQAFSWFMVVLSLLGIVVVLGSFVGSWVVRNTVTDVTVELLTVGETAVSSVSTGLNRVDNRLDTSQDNLVILEDDIIAAGEKVDEANVVGAVIKRTVSDDTVIAITEARSTAVGLADTVAALDEAINAANQIPFVNLDGMAFSAVGQVADGLEELESDIGDFRVEVQERKDEKIEDSVDFLTGMTNKMSIGIDEVQDSITAVDTRLETTSTNLADAKVTLPRIYTTITVIVNVMLLLVGAAFVSLLMHSFALAKNPDLTFRELMLTEKA